MEISHRNTWSVFGFFVLALCAACGSSNTGDDDDDVLVGPVDMFEAADPFIGTGGLGFGVGSAYPGPALPFAMMHLGPDTRMPAGAPGFSHCSGYWYEDNFIEAFSLMRMNGTGLPDYGVLGFMPVDGMTDERRAANGYMARFDHADEQAEPGYYRVRMDNEIQVELTTDSRSGMARIEYPVGSDPVLLVDLAHVLGTGRSTGGELTINNAAISAMMHNDGALSERFGGFDVFAVFEFQPAPMAVGVWDEAGLRPGDTSTTGINAGGWLQFPAGTTEVQIRIGVSFVDAAGAAGNLAAEIPSFDFDGVRTAAAQRWRKELSVVHLEGTTERDATLVASSLYKSLLMPTLVSDADGRYLDTAGQVVSSTTPHYSDFSLWDTYRTLHPWLLLIEDPRNPDFAASFLSFADSGGAFPRWSLAHSDVRSMIGSPAEIVMAESAVKGVEFDQEAAYQYARVTAYGVPPGSIGGRDSIEAYLETGYVPNNHGGSVSRTLEYATADHALSQWARRLGHDDDADELATRASSWQQLFDPSVGFLRSKQANGNWGTWADPDTEDDAYVEGTAWQYLWMVPHDLAGLAEALGGTDAALAKLREFFTLSEAEIPSLGFRVYYWHGNEPDIIAPWIFAAWGEPGESAKWIDWVMNVHYGTGPDGLPGNDDGGTMAAWVLFANAGIYPIAGTDRYIVAAPRQSLMILQRPDGDLRIEAEPNPKTHPRPVSVTLDGEPVDTTELTHAQLAGNRVLRFTMAQ